MDRAPGHRTAPVATFTDDTLVGGDGAGAVRARYRVLRRYRAAGRTLPDERARLPALRRCARAAPRPGRRGPRAARRPGRRRRRGGGGGARPWALPPAPRPSSPPRPARRPAP